MSEIFIVLWILGVVFTLITRSASHSKHSNINPSSTFQEVSPTWRCWDGQFSPDPTVLLLPARSTNPKFGKLIELPLSNPRGSGVKWFNTGQIKEHPLFNHPVRTDPPISGWSPKGEEIPITRLAQWVFGVSGYDGNVRFLPDEGRISFQIPLEAPDQVEYLLRSFYPQALQPETQNMEESFSTGPLYQEPLAEDVLKLNVKTWVRERQVERLK